MSNNHGGLRSGAGRPRKGQEKTDRSIFTSKQVAMLLSSHYVAFISKNTITYTSEFKQLVWQRYCDGIHELQIFQDAGLDTEVLGISRIASFIKYLKSQKEQGLSFIEGKENQLNNSLNQFDIPKKRKIKTPQQGLVAEDIAKLVHKVEYISQELEFLKKITLADKQ